MYYDYFFYIIVLGTRIKKLIFKIWFLILCFFFCWQLLLFFFIYFIFYFLLLLFTFYISFLIFFYFFNNYIYAFIFSSRIFNIYEFYVIFFTYFPIGMIKNHPLNWRNCSTIQMIHLEEFRNWSFAQFLKQILAHLLTAQLVTLFDLYFQ